MSQVQKPKKGYKSVPWLFGKEIEIPQEWECVDVEYVSDKLLSGGTPSTIIPEYWEGNIPWTKGAVLTTNITIKGERLISELGLKNSSTSIIPKDNLLVVSRVSIGNVSINKIDIAINQDITAVILNKTICLTEFLYWNLLQTLSILVSFSQGTTIQGFTRKDLSSHKVLLPPLPEQQQIASILSNVDSLIESTSKIIENSKSLKTGLMQKLLTRGIGHTKFKKVRLKFHFLNYDIPEHWEIIPIKKLSTLVKGAVMTGPFGLMLHSSDYVVTGTPLILIKNIQFGKIIDNDIPKISKEDTERLSRYKVKEGDLVFSRVGRVGSSALIERKHHGWLISGQLLRIRFDNPNLNYYYLNYFIQSHFFYRELIPELLGSTRDSINTEILENLPIIVPPKKEQDKITNILSNIDAQIDSQTQYKEKLERLKKSLMQKLLTGEVRV